MTTVDNNTFTGPNTGISGGYAPRTTIESTPMDSDLNRIKDDLDYHLSILQAIYTKLDTIESAATGDQSSSDILALINGGSGLVDADNIAAEIARDTEVINSVETHRTTAVPGNMHLETSIKNTEQTYSYTPTSLVTSCQNLLDEINNIRLQIDRVIGSTNWTDAPAATIADINTALNNAEFVANKNVASGYVGLDANSDIDLESVRKIKNPEGLQLPVGTNKWV